MQELDLGLFENSSVFLDCSLTILWKLQAHRTKGPTLTSEPPRGGGAPLRSPQIIALTVLIGAFSFDSDLSALFGGELLKEDELSDDYDCTK
jgi:hypothetical protein